MFGSSPWLIAACNVLHRLLAPRHPPIALNNLTEFDARARYAVLKDQSPDIRTTARSIYSASCRSWAAGSEGTPSELNSVPDMPQTFEGSKEDGAKANDRLGVKLLRKEVIQPHLPVRLPCYDFTPITNPTFDGSLPCGLGHRLRVLPTFVV